MTVTGIVPLDKRRSKVFLDEDFTLVLYKGEIRRYQIEENGELPEETYREIVQEILCRRAVERSCYILKSSDKTEQELRRKLKTGFFPEEAIDFAIAFLKEHRYIDDENYGRRYVEFNSARKSRRQIQYELHQKGLSGEAVAELLEAQPIDEEAQIQAYFRKKRLNPETMTPKDRSKVLAALGRKGFSYEAVNRVMGSILADD